MLAVTDSAGAYYYNAMLWAVENGITNGTNTEGTRGQRVTFLYCELGGQ